MLHKVFITICEMLEDRGLEKAVESFKNKFGSELSQTQAESIMHNNTVIEHDNAVRIVFYGSPLKTTSFVDTYIKNTNVDVVIIVLLFDGKQESQMIKQLTDQSDKSKLVQVFKAKELMFNISRHHLVPKHELVLDKEVPALLELYQVKATALPQILQTDPMAKYLGARPGQLVKITRSSPTAGEAVVYRLCVA